MKCVRFHTSHIRLINSNIIINIIVLILLFSEYASGRLDIIRDGKNSHRYYILDRVLSIKGRGKGCINLKVIGRGCNLLRWKLNGFMCQSFIAGPSMPMKQSLNSHTAGNKTYKLGDINIGLVKNVNCNIVINVKEVMGDEYDGYMNKMVKVLFNELTLHGYKNIKELFYNKWKGMKSIALSRGYRILLLEHYMNNNVKGMINTFMFMIDNPYIMNIHSIALVANVINKSYIDGWKVSLSLASFCKSNIELLRRIPVFTDFKVPVMNVSQDSKRVVNYPTEYSKMSTQQAFKNLYKSLLAITLEQREFKIFLSLYHEMLYIINTLNSPVGPNINCKYPTNKNSNIGDYVHLDILKKITGNEEEVEPLKVDGSLKIEGKLENSEWYITVMLKHVLSCIYSTVDLSPVVRDSKHLKMDLSSIASLEGYHMKLNRKRLFNRGRDPNIITVDEFITSLQDKGNVEEINKFIKAPLKETFMKGDGGNKLDDTIHEIRNMNIKTLEVKDIYIYMRKLLNHNITGSTAVNLLFLISPDLTFTRWTHYHIFLCALEADIEEQNVNSLNELLEYMVRLQCVPEPSIYARFFTICNVKREYNNIWKQFNNYINHKNHKNHISLELYSKLLNILLNIGEYQKGFYVFKCLLSDVNGLYRLIPLKIWLTFRQMVQNFVNDIKLLSLVEECGKLSYNKTLTMFDSIEEFIPNQKSALVTELETLIDNTLHN